MINHKIVFAMTFAAIILSNPLAADIYDVLSNEGNAALTLEAANKFLLDVPPPAAPPPPQNKTESQTENPSVTLPTALSTAAPPAAEMAKPLTLRDQAFKDLLNKNFPMRPEQILEYREAFEKNQAAMQATPKTPPQPTSSTLIVDLSPGATPPVIRLATGFVSSVVFVDATGQPWPIADYSLGNPGGFNIQWDSKTHTLFMQSMQHYITGNMAVRLAKLETPVMISLVTGQKDVDYRIDLQLPARGPNALAPIVRQYSKTRNFANPTQCIRWRAPNWQQRTQCVRKSRSSLGQQWQAYI